MPEISFLIVQSTPFCNIDCTYCYLPHRADARRMSNQIMVRVFEGIFASGWCSEQLSIIWHCGEPLVSGPEFYREAFALIERLKPPHVEVHHGMVTNGTLIDDEWCALFKQYGVQVGVSIDGPRDIHDAYRVRRSGEGSFDQALAGFRLLRQHDVSTYVLSVLTDVSLRRAKDLFDFYVAEQIEYVCFNIDEIKGVNHATSLSQETGPEALFDSFLRELWNLLASSAHPFTVREFEQMIHDIVSQQGEKANEAVNTPFVHLTVDSDGNFATFAPELLGMPNARYNNFVIGNFSSTSLAQSEASPFLRRQADDIQEGIALCRAECAYFPVCGGGNPITKLYENGAFASTETLSCRLMKKKLADVVLDIIDAAAMHGGGDEPLNLS